MTTKKLEFNDFIKQKDKDSMQTGSTDTVLKGIVSIKDDTGRTVFSRRNNLILLRGRTFALESLFKDTIGVEGVSGGANPYVSNLERSISGFVVGRSGTTAPSAPFDPKAVEPRDRWLTTEIPFRIHDTAADESQPDIFIPTGEKSLYSNGRAGSTGTQREYYMKRFDNFDPAWNFDEATNEVYKLITMSISAHDCRTLADPTINELGLVIAQNLGTTDASGMPEFTDIELFSKIHFPSEYLAEGKSLSIEYLVYS